jgi:hypothetical protein
LQLVYKFFEVGVFADGFNTNARSIVSHPTRNVAMLCRPENKRPETHALDRAFYGNMNAGIFHDKRFGIIAFSAMLPGF